MAVNRDIYLALASIRGEDRVFDTKIPDDMSVILPVLVFQLITDVPAVPIDGAIIGRDQQWQVSIYGGDISDVRATKESVIEALHGLHGDEIKRAELESALEFYDSDLTPALYHAALTFTVYS